MHGSRPDRRRAPSSSCSTISSGSSSLVVLAVFSLTIPNYFQLGIFANIIEQSTFVGIMAIGLSLVIIAGHMDLSVESVMALAAMVIGILFCSAASGSASQLHAGMAGRAGLAADRAGGRRG